MPRLRHLLTLSLGAALLHLPSVQAEELPEAIKKIEDRATREKFAGLCSRRSPAAGGIAPTEKPMNWLELADPKDQEAKP